MEKTSCAQGACEDGIAGDVAFTETAFPVFELTLTPLAQEQPHHDCPKETLSLSLSLSVTVVVFSEARLD